MWKHQIFTLQMNGHFSYIRKWKTGTVFSYQHLSFKTNTDPFFLLSVNLCYLLSDWITKQLGKTVLNFFFVPGNNFAATRMPDPGRTCCYSSFTDWRLLFAYFLFECLNCWSEVSLIQWASGVNHHTHTTSPPFYNMPPYTLSCNLTSSNLIPAAAASPPHPQNKEPQVLQTFQGNQKT